MIDIGVCGMRYARMARGGEGRGEERVIEKGGGKGGRERGRWKAGRKERKGEGWGGIFHCIIL